MVKLGVSLYPEQETMEQMESYIKLASKYGFTKIFTSMFSVQGETSEVKQLFTDLCTLAHQYGMEVCVDSNSEMFEEYGATVEDLSVFKEIGVDEIRMDMSYGDIKDKILVDNPFGIKIQFSAYMTDILVDVVNSVKNKNNISMCHNFYPQRYTGTRLSKFMDANKVWQHLDVEVAAFITSNDPQAHGPWPVKDGLPTLERHRYQTVDFQVRDMIAMGLSTIYFGNAFASEEELKEASHALKEMTRPLKEADNDVEYLMRQILPNLGKHRVIMGIEDVQDLNDVEEEILLNFEKHCEIGDSNEYMLRSRVTRMLYSKQSIPARQCDKKKFEFGDILIVNDNLKHYCGEIQVCLSDMDNDGQRNYVGKVKDIEKTLIGLVKPGTYYRFIQ